MKTKTKNLLIMGACGTLAHAVLTYLKNHRHLFNELILLDKKPFKDDAFRTLEDLHAGFVKMNINLPHAKDFKKLLKDKKIDLVLDLSDADTELTAQLIFENGKASYICCGFS